MRPSRGMGIINPSKMPTAKTITRKDDPNAVTMFDEGGRVPKPVESDYSMRVIGGGSANEYGAGLGGRASLTKKLVFFCLEFSHLFSQRKVLLFHLSHS